MKHYICATLLLICTVAVAPSAYAQEPTPSVETTYSSTPAPEPEVEPAPESRTDVKIDIQQPSPPPAPAPAPDVNINVRETSPSVIKTESTKETSVTKIVQPVAEDNSGVNVVYLLIGGVVAAALGLGIYSVSKRT